MKTYLSWLAGALVVISLTVGTAHTDDLFDGDNNVGPVGTTTEEGAGGTGPEERIPGWEDLNEEVWGPAARAEEYLPHEACDMCFTLPNYSPYQVREYVKSDVPDGAIIVTRRIPNPAPEIQAREDYDPEIGGYLDPETGERIWFIGTRGVLGPTDEEKWSPDLPVSTIEMKRIKARHLHRISSMEGVTTFGIGTHGFVIGLSPHVSREDVNIPDTIEGIPVTVETRGLLRLNGHEDAHIRPIPAGVSAGRGEDRWGTLGPHLVRDTDTSGDGTCCEMLSIGAGHALNPTNASTGWQNSAIYSPGKFNIAANYIGSFAYVFHRLSCGTVQYHNGIYYAPESCGAGAIQVNDANVRPDVALVSYGFFSEPFDDPTGAEPTRRMQYRATKDVRGPSGNTEAAATGHKHKVWGAVTGAHDTGSVVQVDQCALTVANLVVGDPVYRYCGLNFMDYRTVPGDSGAMVAYKGEGHHYIAGVVVGGSFETDDTTVTAYIPADSIIDALDQADQGVSYYWGTDEAKWGPATDDGDD